MDQIPTVIGLLICEQATVEQGTKNLSLINCFTRKKISDFPSSPQRFSVVAFLTDGFGAIPLEIAVSDLETLDDIDRFPATITFKDRLQEVRVVFRVTNISFPHKGAYDVSLFAGDNILAQHRLHVD
ncbi:MAG: hypothetical protein L0215_02485 [Gemmataceae bacterium]|nr:hypothetical protein [Gemmataceae bacterium]